MGELDEFREAYRSGRIGSGYSGRMHLAFVVAFCIGGVVFSATRLDSVQPLEWLTVPLTFLYANLVEYFGHRFVMHRRRPGLGLVFERHALQHHRFFTDRNMALDNWRDLKAVLFPVVLLMFFFGAFAVPSALLLGWLAGGNVAWLFVATALAYYLNYELLHLAYHLPDDSRVHRLPGLKALGRLHHAHHRPGNMARTNFNITYPIGDWLFGTWRR